MNHVVSRRAATRFRTPRLLLAVAGAAALSLALPGPANAQGAGHHGHGGHAGHGMQTTKKALAKTPAKDPAKRQRTGREGGHAGHAGYAGGPADTPAVSEFKAAHANMMKGMAVPYTGDPDADFRIQMIPHHEGAIDMARVALRHAKDAWTRQLAESVIVEQQREIAEMQAWLGRRGIAAPAGGRPRHIMNAASYRYLDEEAGTPGELVGQSWAPGSGVPPRR